MTVYVLIIHKLQFYNIHGIICIIKMLFIPNLSSRDKIRGIKCKWMLFNQIFKVWKKHDGNIFLVDKNKNNKDNVMYW